MPTLQKNGNNGSHYLVVPKKICEERGWTKGTVFSAVEEEEGIRFRELR
jgi:hypothetical protein